MAKGTRRIALKEKCPCGSGKLYKNCCHGKRFEWIREKDGNVYRATPMNAAALEALDETRKEFLKIFEREPRATDPVFILQYLLSERDIERETIEAMERAGIDPAKIYAYKQTNGLLVTTSNLDLIPDKDIAAWEAAVDEYFELQRNPPPESEELIIWENFIEELTSCIIAFGYLLEHGGNPKHQQSRCASRYVNFESYAILCATRSFKTLRSIKYLLDKEIGDDCLPLARNIYENYLHIVYAKSNPDKLADLVDAVVGLKIGTHEYIRNKKGGIDRRTIVDKSSGQRYEGHISNYRMAESSKVDADKILFSYIYEFLSEYIHPSFNTAHLIVEKNGKLNTKVNELQYEALLYSLCFSCMIFDEIRLLPSISDEVAADIQTVATRTAKKAIGILRKCFDSSFEHIKVLIERLEIIGMTNRG